MESPEILNIGDNQLIQMTDNFNVHVYLEELKEPETIPERRRRYKKYVRPFYNDVVKVMKPTMLINDPETDNTYMLGPNNAVYVLSHFMNKGQFDVVNDILDVIIQNTPDNVMPQ